MSPSPAARPSQEEALRLHQRLLEGDPTARHDLAEAYLGPLVAWLGEKNPAVPPEFHVEAAEDAVLGLLRDPQSYDPGRQTLEVYLRLSARGDLRNRLRKEWKHRKGRVPLERVEVSRKFGKYVKRDDDPSLSLRIAEQADEAARSVPDAVREGLTEGELRALDLLRRRERRVAAYAEALGITHLPLGEQRQEVKRVKDRLTKRLQRAGKWP